jgi:hypothetical protein
MNNFDRNQIKSKKTKKLIPNKIARKTNQNIDLIEAIEKNNIKYENTFIIEKSLMNPGLDYTTLIKILEQYGLKQSTDPNKNHLFGITNKYFYNTEFYLINNFQFDNSISDKYTLYINLEFFFPDYYNNNYPRSIYLQSTTNWKDLSKLNNVFICRPIDSDQGIDIIKVYDEKTLEYAKMLLYKEKYINGASLTEYITNPILYDGRKLHLRCYVLFTYINNEFNSYLFDIAEIFTAKEKYKNTDWNNKDIHDSHFKNSGISALFPNDAEKHITPKFTNTDIEIIFKNIREAISYVSKIAISSIYQYSNTKNTYEIFGIDVFVRDDLRVFIIEINSKFIGYDGAEFMFEKYFKWIDDNVIKPTLFPLLQKEQSTANTPILTTKLKDY